jgi:hypothetical protein
MKTDKIYIDHVNGRWEAYSYEDGDKYNTGVYRYDRLDLVRFLHSYGYEVIDISKA